MRNLLVTLSLMTIANIAIAKNEKFQVTTVEVDAFEFESLSKGTTTSGGFAGGQFPSPTFPSQTTPSSSGSTTDKVGSVIGVARDIVALGEEVYKLVQKGKPTNTTVYAPIAIVPKDPATKEHVDPFDMEYCSMPTTKKFLSTVKSGLDVVVRFEYQVLFTHGCSYNESGSYIQQAMIMPVSIKTEMGWDFNAEMKFGGIMNHGSKVDPVAGVVLIMKYSMNSWRAAFEQNSTVHLTGKGEIKTY